MKKIALLLVFALVLSIPLNTMAATPWVIRTTPSITFAGTAATCNWAGGYIPQLTGGN